MVSQLRALTADRLGDRQLLLQFAAAADHAAFADLVHRHGKLVLGVCHRVLGPGPDLDDAFQATFVVLARKAASIRNQHSLAGWLSSVAYRVASDLRKRRTRRRHHEVGSEAALALAPQRQGGDPALEVSRREIGPIIDEELERLPATDREALVLCLMQGLSQREAAEQLGWPLGTLKTRLERARQTLRQRLRRRGFALSALALSVVLAEQTASAVPPELVRATCEGALHGGGSANVTSLADTAVRALAAGKSKTAWLTALGACLLGTALALTGGGQGAPPGQAREAPLPKAVLPNPLPAAVPTLPAGALAELGRKPYHSGTHILASELSPDGARLATAASRSVTVWDVDSGKVQHRFFFDISGLYPEPDALAFSPDGRLLASRKASDRIVVWDLTTGKEWKRFTVRRAPVAFTFFRFSADGKHLIALVAEGLVWLNLATGATERTLRVHAQQLTADDRTFAAVDQRKGIIRIGATATGKVAHTLPVVVEPGLFHRGVLFLPDGVTLAALHQRKTPKEDGPKEVQFWNTATGQRLKHTWSLPASYRLNIYSLRVSADGLVLYYAEDGKHIHRYDLNAGKELPPLPLNGKWVRAVFPHPDGKQLLSVGVELIRRWDLRALAEVSRDEDFIDRYHQTISPDGRWLALGAVRCPLELRDLESGKTTRLDLPGWKGRSLAFTADSRMLAVNRGDHVRFLRLPDLAEVKQLKAGREPFGYASLQFSPDGRHLAVLTSTGRLRVLDLTTKKEVWRAEKIHLVLFTPDSKRILLTPPTAGVVRWHEIRSGKALFEVEVSPRDRTGEPWKAVMRWSFSPDGRVLAVVLVTGEVLLLRGGDERWRSDSRPALLPLGAAGNPDLHASALAFSPDGEWLATGTVDGSLRIWEVATRRELHRVHGHDSAAQTLAFTGGGRRLVSFWRGEGILWDLRPRQDKPPVDPFADLQSRDGPKVYRAFWALAADPKAPAWLRDRIAPRRVDYHPERVAKWLADMEDSRFQVRIAARRALTELEGSARSALAAALDKTPALETKRRLRQLLEALDGEPAGSELRALRAVRILERQRSAASRRVLREWSEGTPGMRLTDAARAALARLGRP
jgi:RNA polymerase sigma factor (sigma-70 family)